VPVGKSWVRAGIHDEHGGHQLELARALDGDPDRVEEEEQQRQVLVDGPQQDIESPGGHQEQEG